MCSKIRHGKTHGLSDTKRACAFSDLVLRLDTGVYGVARHHQVIDRVPVLARLWPHRLVPKSEYIRDRTPGDLHDLEHIHQSIPLSASQSFLVPKAARQVFEQAGNLVRLAARSNELQKQVS